MAIADNQAKIGNILFNFFSTYPGFNFLAQLYSLCCSEKSSKDFDWFQFFHAMNETVSLLALIPFLLPDGCPGKDDVSCRLDPFSVTIETTCSQLGLRNLTVNNFGRCIPTYDEGCDPGVMGARLGMAVAAITTDWMLFFAKLFFDRGNLSKQHQNILGGVAGFLFTASIVAGITAGLMVKGTVRDAELFITSSIFASSVTSRLGIDAISDEIARIAPGMQLTAI
jgi:hypothetical protein